LHRAAPSRRRCARSPPASWSCRDRCRPRAGARAAPATGPARRSASGPLLAGLLPLLLFERLVSGVDLLVEPFEKHQLSDEIGGALVVLRGIDLPGDFFFQITFHPGNLLAQPVQ